jgi:hypothetical protein
MAARIFNKLVPAEDGILCDSPTTAEAKLKEMLKQFKARGFLVSETRNEDGRLYGVSDEQGRPVGIYYIE